MWDDRHKDILFEAAQLAGTERARFLDAACGDDAELRRAVEALLVAHDAAGDFLAERPGVGLLADEPPEGEEPGARIDDYRLVALIGEGGFGKVFLAEQERPIVRRVAVKVVRPGMDSAQVIARFAAERQVLAMMAHDGIAAVYDAGRTRAGRPYFVMEYVDGEPITDYCDAHELTIRARLELFEKVCHAVHHAHQKGVIHRDLKPSNVLVAHVDGEARPKVIDFGIAKAMHEGPAGGEAKTAIHQIVGTPQYMSPEQMELRSTDIDTRSDIYSLGVLLYELLAGAPPFDPERFRRGSYREIADLLREERPPRPSTRVCALGSRLVEVARDRRVEPAALRRVLRYELDWIVLKAMEKDRNRRYPAASGLANDVRRYLRDQPIEARPPGMGYLVRKFVRRHRVAVGAAGLALAGLITGLVVALYLLGETRALLFESYVSEARAARSGRAPGRRFRALRVLGEAARLSPALEVRNEAIAAMMLADAESERTFRIEGSATAQGLDRIDRFADVTADGEVRVIAVADGAVLAAFESQDLPVVQLTFDAGGTFLAAGYRDADEERAIVWEVASGRRVVECRAPGCGTGLAVFDGRGPPQWVGVPATDGTLLVHRLPDGRQVARPSLAGGSFLAVAAPGAARLAVVGRDAPRLVVRDVHDWAAPEIEFDVALPSEPFSAAWSRDGTAVAVGLEDGRIVVVDARSGTVCRELERHDSPTVRVAFAHDPRLLVSHGWDATVRLWDLESGDEILEPLSNFVLAGCADRIALRRREQLELWSFTRGDEFARIEAAGPFGRWSFVSLGPSGRFAVTGGMSGVDLWDLSTASHLARLDDRAARGVHLLPDLGGVLAAVAASGTPPGAERQAAQDLLLWPLRRAGDRLVPLAPEHLWSHPGTMWTALSHDARLLIAGREEGGWDLTLFDLDRRAAQGVGGYTGLAAPPSLSPDGRYLFSGNWRGEPGRVRDLQTGTETLLLPPTPHMTGEFSADGRWLAAATGEEVRVYAVGRFDVPAYTRRRPYPQDVTGPVAFGAKGRLLACTESRSVVVILTAATGEEVARLTAPDHLAPTHLAFSRDGSVLAGLTRGRSMIVWHLDRIRARLARMGLDWQEARAAR